MDEILRKIDEEIAFLSNSEYDYDKGVAKGFKLAKEIILAEQKESINIIQEEATEIPIEKTIVIHKQKTRGDVMRLMNNEEIKDILVEFQLRGFYKKDMMFTSDILAYLDEAVEE